MGDSLSDDIVDVDADSMLQMQDASQRPVPESVMLRENFTPLQEPSGSVHDGDRPSFQLVGYPIDASDCLSRRPYEDDPKIEEADDYPHAETEFEEPPTAKDEGGLSSSQLDLMWPNIDEVYREIETPPEKEIHSAWKERVRRLCKLTGTEAAIDATIEGMRVGSYGHIRNPRLHEHITQNHFCHQAYTYMVAVWLVVCFKISDKHDPGRIYLSEISGSLCMSAWMLMPSQSAPPQTEYFEYTKYWESKLYVSTFSWFTSNSAWLRKVPKDALLPGGPISSPLEPSAKELMEALGQPTSITSLSKLLLQQEKCGKFTPIKKLCEDATRERWALEETIQMFSSISPSIVESCIRQRVARDAFQESHETAHETSLNGKESDKPVIYLNSLCDRSGMAPTPRQWGKAIRLALEYISTDNTSVNEMAEEVDQAIAPTRKWPRDRSRSGFRRYADYRKVVIKGLDQKDQDRRNMIEYFLRNMSARVSADFSVGRANIPFEQGVNEIGFTKNPKRRLRDHARHTHSNFIMNLMQAIFAVLFPGMFVLSQHVLHVCWRPSHAWLGEIHFTQLCNAYTNRGGGFSHYPAGYSNGGAFRTSNLHAWHMLEQWADARFDVFTRLKEEARKGREYITATKGKIQQWDEIKAANEQRSRAEDAAAERAIGVLQASYDLLDTILDFTTELARIRN